MSMTIAGPVVRPSKVSVIPSSAEKTSLSDVMEKLGFKELIKGNSDALKLQLVFIKLFFDANNIADKISIEGALGKQLHRNDAEFYFNLDPIKHISDISISKVLAIAGSSISAPKVETETQDKISKLLSLLPKDDPNAKKKVRDINNAIRELNTPKNS